MKIYRNFTIVFCCCYPMTRNFREEEEENFRNSESQILKETIDNKFLKHVTKYWEENGRIKRDFEIKNLSEWIISEYVFLSGFAIWFREKERDDGTDLSSLLSNATGESVEVSASIEFDQDRLNLVSEIPTQILEKIMNINPAGKIAYRSLDMAIMKAMSKGHLKKILDSQPHPDVERITLQRER